CGSSPISPTIRGWRSSSDRGHSGRVRFVPSPVFPIRLLALDIDGTLVGPDLGLRDRTVAAVRAAVARGVSVSLVTGRMSTSAREFADVLGLVDPIVAHQGAVIRAMSVPG